MRVGLLTCDLNETHGWGTYSLRIIQELRRADIEVRIFSARNSPPQPDIPDQQRLLPNVAPAQRGLLLRQTLLWPTLSRALNDCDIIHSTVEPYAPLAWCLARHRPYFVTAHGSFIKLLPERRWPGGMLYYESLRRSHLICVSRYTAEVAQANLPGVQPAIPNGSTPRASANRRALRFETQGPTVLSVGAVKPRKGTLELVQSMAQVRKTVPDVQCVIIGGLDNSPDYVAQIRDTIAELNLEETVHLLGRVDEDTLRGWYAAADIFVQPAMNTGSRFEGFGLVYLEANAAGLPVIGTTGSGVEDAIDEELPVCWCHSQA